VAAAWPGTAGDGPCPLCGTGIRLQTAVCVGVVLCASVGKTQRA
jgi:hypothetical protein